MRKSLPSAETMQILKDLVAFDTVSRNSNVPIIDYIEELLARHGVTSRRVNGTEGKQSLIATIGPAHAAGIVLAAHTDVVPVADQHWSADPFALRTIGDRAIGRGVTDMKGFAACLLAHAPKILAAPLYRPVHLIFTHDEEIGCLAMPFIIDDLKKWPLLPMAAIVGEPTGMSTIIAHKGKISFRVEVKGRGGHSALSPKACNAVEYAADLVVFIRNIGKRLMKTEKRDADYDIPFTTAHTGSFHGGSALNIVPDRCEFEFEFRALPLTSLRALADEVETYAKTVLLPQMRLTAPEADIIFHPRSHIPGLDTPADAGVVDLVAQWAEQQSQGAAKVAYGTEAGFYQQELGIPTVVCGPGDIADAHLPDESIALSQLAHCERFLENLVAWCSTEPMTGSEVAHG